MYALASSRTSGCALVFLACAALGVVTTAIVAAIEGELGASWPMAWLVASGLLALALWLARCEPRRLELREHSLRIVPWVGKATTVDVLAADTVRVWGAWDRCRRYAPRYLSVGEWRLTMVGGTVRKGMGLLTALVRLRPDAVLDIEPPLARRLRAAAEGWGVGALGEVPECGTYRCSMSAVFGPHALVTAVSIGASWLVALSLLPAGLAWLIPAIALSAIAASALTWYRRAIAPLRVEVRDGMLTVGGPDDRPIPLADLLLVEPEWIDIDPDGRQSPATIHHRGGAIRLPRCLEGWSELAASLDEAIARIDRQLEEP